MDEITILKINGEYAWHPKGIEVPLNIIKNKNKKILQKD